MGKKLNGCQTQTNLHQRTPLRLLSKVAKQGKRRMQLQPERNERRVGWNQRVSWNGAIQWLLLITLVASISLMGSSQNTNATAEPIAWRKALESATTAAEDRVDPRIVAMALRTPQQSVRVIVQKMGQDATVERLVAEMGGKVVSPLPIINAFAAEMSTDAAYQLGKNPSVRWISIDAQVHSTLTEIITGRGKKEPPNTYLDTLGIPDLWKQKLSGTGIGVAVIDSGVDTGNDFSQLAINKGFNLNSVTPLDLYGHGTHIAGIVAGNGRNSYGKYIGIAPATTLVGLKVSNDLGLAFESDVVKAIQWVHENKARYNIRVVNLSLNSGVESSYHTSPLNAAAEILWFSGVVVVVSAGNSGGQSGYNTVLAPPANDPFFITVGASDERGTAGIDNDVVAAYSAAGITLDGYRKPDIIAPGTAIYSVMAKHSPWPLLYPDRTAGNGKYFRMSGTSMAAPMVVGVVALMLQDEPHLTPDQVKYRLINSTSRTLDTVIDGETVSLPYLDAVAAVNGTTTESANTGLVANQLLWTGSSPVDWSSVNWNSVNWNSVNWNSVNWNSVNWNSVNWNSALLETVTVDGILPLAEGESWDTPALPTEVPNVKFEPQLDQVLDSFIYLPSIEN
jgi:serine protease AprX